AIAKGLKEVAITEHGPRNIGVTEDKIWQCRKDIEQLRKENSDIKIYFGIEADIVSENGELDINASDYSKFDIMLAGFHRFAIPYTWRDFKRYYIPGIFHYMKCFLTESIIKRNTQALIKAIENNPIDMVAHINNRSIVNVKEVAKVCADNGVYLELNTKHLRELDPIIEDLLSVKDVLFIANTDSHFPSRVGCFEKNEEFIKKYNMQDRVVNLASEVVFRSQRTAKQ
ncbi:MAG: PHP domain-containing protein, partial [Clostridia bacterium]|nr:PHP domain-containing protein [Clostridia bacterium]